MKMQLGYRLDTYDTFALRPNMITLYDESGQILILKCNSPNPKNQKYNLTCFLKDQT